MQEISLEITCIFRGFWYCAGIKKSVLNDVIAVYFICTSRHIQDKACILAALYYEIEENYKNKFTGCWFLCQYYSGNPLYNPTLLQRKRFISLTPTIQT